MKWIFIFLTISFFTQCKSTKPMIVEKEEVIKKTISFSKSSCFGNCATYKMEIYNKGFVILDALAHNPMQRGIYYKELAPSDFEKISQLQNTIDWTKIDRKYMMNIPDLPTTELKLYFKDSTKNKIVSSNLNPPNEVESMYTLLHNLTKQDKWIEVQKKDDIINPNIMYDRLQVNIDTGMSIQTIDTAFKEYGLIQEKKISQYMNFWEMSYDTSKINKYEMVVFLQRFPGVHSARFNRKLEVRE